MTASAPPRAVLLTGATGSLGGRICADLASQTDVIVHCLVRAKGGSTAADRLRVRLDHPDLQPVPDERLVTVPADILQPDLGLTPGRLDELAQTIEGIFHCAAKVHLAKPYEELEAANVGGTRALIALAERRHALTARPVPFHYISTLGAFVNSRAVGIEALDETATPTRQTAGRMGYPQTKAAAEEVLRAAAARGRISLTVYRPGLLLADSHSGNTSQSDLLLPLLTACAALGTCPSEAMYGPAEAADVVSRSIVRLSLRDDAPGRAFHLVRPDSVRVLDAVDAMTRAGHRLTILPPDVWWRQVQEHSSKGLPLPLARMSEFGRFLIAHDTEHQVPWMRSEATWSALTDGWPEPDPLDSAYFDRMITALHAAGTLPAPA